MAECKVCIEKDKMIASEKVRIEDILSGYKKEKELAISEEAFYRKVIKYISISMGVLIVELILTMAYGKDGIMMGVDIVKGFIK